jgi:hypothetical protein
MRWLTHLAEAHPRGLFVAAAGAVLGNAKSLSFGRQLVMVVARDMPRRHGKLPAALGDLYQLACLLVVGMIWLAWSRHAPSPGIVTWSAAVVLLYRALEISIILLAWVFVDTARLHSYRRSVIGFTLNAAELGLISAALGMWLDCGAPASSAWHQFAAVITLDSSLGPTPSLACSALAGARFLLSAALLLLVLSTLAGGLIRREVPDPEGRTRGGTRAPNRELPGER